MSKHLFSFVIAFVFGTVVALAARSAWHQPHAAPGDHASGESYQPMVDNSAASSGHAHAHDHDAPPPPKAEKAEEKAEARPGADSQEPREGAKASGTVNTVCAICGMDVDPSIKPAVYQGKQIGFGCRMCPPKFARDPDRYGPAALANKVVED